MRIRRLLRRRVHCALMSATSRHATGRIRAMRTLLPMITLTLIACGGAENTNESTHATVDEPTPLAPVTPQRCIPPGLESARALTIIPLPAGCSVIAPGTLEAPLLVANAPTSPLTFVARVQCRPPLTLRSTLHCSSDSRLLPRTVEAQSWMTALASRSSRCSARPAPPTTHRCLRQ